MKTVKRILIILLLLLIVTVTVFFCIWRNEILTLSSFKLMRERFDLHNNGAVYTMNVKGGFYLDEFIAQGGVKNDDEFFAFMTDKITKGLVDIKLEAPKMGCSSFTAEDKSGDKLFARNYDFVKANTCIVFTENSGERHSTISTVDLGFLGTDREKNVESLTDRLFSLAAPYVPLDGINDAGVVCGINMSYQGKGDGSVPTDQNTERPDFTSTTLLRLILDYADNVEEAVEIAQTYDMHESAGMSFHYFVADASGKSAILQWIGDEDETDNDGTQRTLKVIYNDKDDKVGEYESRYTNQVNTNFILQPGYHPESDKGLDYKMHGYDRYQRIWEQLDATDGIVDDEKAAMDILASVGARKWYEGGAAVTVHSAVYNMTDKSVLWVPNERYDEDDNAYYCFSFEK